MLQGRGAGCLQGHAPLTVPGQVIGVAVADVTTAIRLVPQGLTWELVRSVYALGLEPAPVFEAEALSRLL